MKATRPYIPQRSATASVIALLSAFGLTACETDRTEGGVPEYDAQTGQTQDGRFEIAGAVDSGLAELEVPPGETPEFDVAAPDVNVSLEERTITVPTQDGSGEEQIPVPQIRVDFPDEDEAEQTIQVELEVPDRSFDVAIEEIYLTNDKYWVVSQMDGAAGADRGMNDSTGILDTTGQNQYGQRQDQSGLQDQDDGLFDTQESVTVSDHAVVIGPDLDVRHIIIGQKPAGVEDRQDYTWINSRQALEGRLQESQLLYDRSARNVARGIGG